MNRVLFFLSLAGLVCTQVGCGDPDPGVCYTNGDFEASSVPASYLVNPTSYATEVCRQWVTFLTRSCIQVAGLPLNLNVDSTEGQIRISDYCHQNVQTCSSNPPAGYSRSARATCSSDERGDLHFSVQHTCNFVNNPSYSCAAYGGATESSAQTIDSLDDTQLSALQSAVRNDSLLLELLTGEQRQALSIRLPGVPRTSLIPAADFLGL
jgi:hypothetical protein